MNWDAASGLIWKLLAVVGLVLLNGFFVAAEFALVKVRGTQLDALYLRGSRLARATRRVTAHLDTALSACQLGITLASLGLGWIGEPVFYALLSPLWTAAGLGGPEWAHGRKMVAVIVGFSAITFLHITAGEQAPKWLAIQRPVQVALAVSRPLEWFQRLSYPFIWLLNSASLWILRRLGLQAAGEGAIQSEEELRLVLSEATQVAGGTEFGRYIVLNALDLRHRVARDVMRPRRELAVLDTTASIADCLELAERTRYSRFPLCVNGDPDRMLGVVHIKELFAARHKAVTAADLASAARKLIYVPETARLENLLRHLLDRKLHLAIVVDEYGGTVGLVTLENILEELVGQIQDEFDQEKPLVVRTSPTEWHLDGALPLHELAELAGESIVATDVATVSGYVAERLGGFPKAGDRLTIGTSELAVEETDGLRVTRLKLVRPAPE